MATGTLSPSQGVRPPRFQSADFQEGIAGFLFVLPALLVAVLFIFIPIIFALYISFTDWTGIQPPNEANWVGFQNYQNLLFGRTDPNNPDRQLTATRDEFFKTIKNTVYYVIGVVPTQTVLALLLAVIVNQKFLRGRGLFRTAFYFPSITSSVVIGTIFLWLFNRNGIVNGALEAVTFGNYQTVNWLADPRGVIHNIFDLFGLTLRTAPEWMRTEIAGQRIWDWISGPSTTMLVIMILAIWTTSGTLMLIFLAALQDIPPSLYEAASVDGANRWQQFRRITVPMLRPTTFFVVTIGLIGTFQVFDQVFVISKGEPAQTTSTIAWIVYRNAFQDNTAGLGAATAFILFILIMIFTLIQRRFSGANQ
jgi:multiple sugar transport system permease protein